MAERRKRTRTDPHADALRILASDGPDRLARLLACFGPALPAERLRWEPSDPEWPAATEWNPNELDSTLDSVPVGSGGRLGLAAAGPIDRDTLSTLVTAIRMLAAERELSQEIVPLRAAETKARLDLRGTRHQLTVTRDLERQRLLASLLSFAGEPLAEVGLSLAELEHNPNEEQLIRVRDALDLATDRFRTVARGIYPVMLREQGPTGTLQQLAATLAGPVEFGGDLGPRAGWEVESGLYHAAARTMIVLSEAAEIESPVRVELTRTGDRLAMTLTTRGRAGVADVGASLADAAGRISALGGGLIVRADQDVVGVDLWLDDGLDYRP